MRGGGQPHYDGVWARESMTEDSKVRLVGRTIVVSILDEKERQQERETRTRYEYNK